MSNCRGAGCRIKCSKREIISFSSLDELECCFFSKFDPAPHNQAQKRKCKYIHIYSRG